MGILEKFGLIEVDEEQVAPATQPEIPAQETNVDSASIYSDTEDYQSVIDRIYEGKSLPSDGTTIYLLAKYMKTLPAEMTIAKSQETLNGIFSVAGISVYDMIADAGIRIAVLGESKDDIAAEQKKIIDDATNDIEKLKQMIEVANQEIASCNKTIQLVTAATMHEISEVTRLKEFAEQMLPREEVAD